MTMLDPKAHFLFGMMLGEIWENAANRAFSSREFHKTTSLFYNEYYLNKVMRLYNDYKLIADFSNENRLHCHLGSVDTSCFSLDPELRSSFGN